jgi:hypothetical protein
VTVRFTIGVLQVLALMRAVGLPISSGLEGEAVSQAPM